MQKDFQIIEHTADVGIKAFGSTLSEAFANTARGMFSLITDLDSIGEILHRDIRVKASSRELLLVEWLNELIYLFDVENVLFHRFEFVSLTETGLKARCYGEKVNRDRHELKTGIKSATYHMLEIKQNTGYTVQVLFDI